MSISKITELREKRAALINEQRQLLDQVDGESRDLTAEEGQEFDRRTAEIDGLDTEVRRRESLAGLQPTGLTPQAVEPAGVESRELVTVDSDEYRSLYLQWMRSGFGDGVERRDLTVGTTTAGGHTVPVSMHNEIVQTMRDFGVMRQISRVITTSGGEDLRVPTVTAYGASAWEGEGDAYGGSDPTFGLVTLSAYKIAHIAKVTEELLQDSAFDIAGLVSNVIGQNLGVAANTAYLVGAGSGSDQPTGLTSQTTVGKTGGSGQTTSVIADDLFDLYHSVLPPYRRNAVWLMNDATIKAVRKLKVNSNDEYVWQPGLQAGQPDTLLGRPVYADPDVPVMAVSAKSILFGDFSFFWIRDAGTVQMQRLDELFAANGIVGFRGHFRTDGKLVDAGAIKHYANAAS